VLSAALEHPGSRTFTRVRYRLESNPWPESGVRSWLTDLPPLPNTFSPDSDNWSNSIAICAVMKDENITDVMEWIAYHQCVTTVSAFPVACKCDAHITVCLLTKPLSMLQQVRSTNDDGEPTSMLAQALSSSSHTVEYL
jgi:hypothetical protein